MIKMIFSRMKLTLQRQVLLRLCTELEYLHQPVIHSSYQSSGAASSLLGGARDHVIALIVASSLPLISVLKLLCVLLSCTHKPRGSNPPTFCSPLCYLRNHYWAFGENIDKQMYAFPGKLFFFIQILSRSSNL